MSHTLTVNLGERSYPLWFGSDLSAAVRSHVDRLRAEQRKVVVVADRQLVEVQKNAFAQMFSDLPVFTVPPGEESKSGAALGEIWDFFAGERVDRTSTVFAIGGGVVGDLAGFAAASFLRGIDFVQIPTTLLSMVDSSVGGKTGINLKAGKNLVGAFHQPKGVYIATDLLRTLPPREFAAGMAEVIKYGLFGDARLFERLERSPLTVGSEDLASVIHTCCSLKAKVVEADERELAKEGGRAILNLGHTFGHAIEQVAGYGVYLHGEAVAIGLCAAARLSAKLGLIGASEIARVEKCVLAHQLPAVLRVPLPLTELLAAMSRDKKVRAGSLRFVVLNSIGSASTRSGVPTELAEASFREVGASSS